MCCNIQKPLRHIYTVCLFHVILTRNIIISVTALINCHNSGDAILCGGNYIFKYYLHDLSVILYVFRAVVLYIQVCLYQLLHSNSACLFCMLLHVSADMRSHL
jgi:hypothetical protein